MWGGRNGMKWGRLALASLVGMAAWGCPKDKPVDMTGTAGVSTTSGVGAGNAKKYRIAVIPKGTAHQFWQSVHAGADKAGEEIGAEIVWQGPNPEGDITDQINVAQNQIIAKADGIVLAATDATALGPVVKTATDKGIPVVTIDSGIRDTTPVCYIATDNIKGGRDAADALAKEIGGKGKVGMLIFGKGQVSSDQRQQGFIQGINKYPGIQIVATLENNDVTKAVDTTTNMLQANPDIVGIFAASEPNGIGAANYLRQRKLAGKVKLVAFDSSDEEVRDLEDGSIQALVVQDPYQMGYKGVLAAVKAIKKEPIADKTVDSGLMVITKANMTTPEASKLLHPARK